ncbi:hypothetical protein T492DRAFT_943087 [Pavlovales sp. CCMP2436]|nr:hypothetical protein T492DRAFT_943087 [Pavlovales sp. CCMP2436]
MVLIRDELLAVPAGIELSRATFRRIRLNFAWALAFNLVGIPFASGVLYPLVHVALPPELAAMAMAFSSVAVVTSSLLLKRFTPSSTPARGAAVDSRRSQTEAQHTPLSEALLG